MTDLALVGARVRTLDPGAPVGDRGRGRRRHDRRGRRRTPRSASCAGRAHRGHRPARRRGRARAHRQPPAPVPGRARRARRGPAGRRLAGRRCSGWSPRSAPAARRTSGCSASGSTTTRSAEAGTSGDLIEDGRRRRPGAADVHGLPHRARHVAGARARRRRRARGSSASTPRSSCVDGVPTGELRESAAMDLVRAAMPELTAAERYRLCADAAAAAGRRRASPARTRWTATSRRSTCCASSRATATSSTRLVAPFWIEPGDDRGRLGGSSRRTATSAGARWRAGVAKFFIDGVIDSGTGWLVRARQRGRRARRRSGPTRRTTARAVRFFAVARLPAAPRTPRGDRGVREALDAYRERRRGAGRAPPHRAHRDAPAARPAAVRGRGRRRLDAGAAHDVARRPTAATTGRGGSARRALRPGVPDPLAARVRRGDRARLRLAGGALRPARGHGRRAPAPAAAASATARPTTTRRIDGLDRAGGLHDAARRSRSATQAPARARRARAYSPTSRSSPRIPSTATPDDLVDAAGAC